ncbi:MAG: G-D-S-L family lipolytic protein [Bacteroidetes bacterium]|nr:MAG: G-D-S-L family lipolytic protein [Bacteroidota bacterium]
MYRFVQPLIKSFYTIIIVFSWSFYAQENKESEYLKQAESFSEEVAKIADLPVPTWDSGIIIFTGSSSVRLWGDAGLLSKGSPIINTAFGGSTAYGLNVYLEDLVLRYEPKQVFIYEGDNDIAAGRDTRTILEHLDTIFTRIWEQNPEVEIVYISAKPSPLRWELRKEYEALNKAVERRAKKEDRLVFADVYSSMLQKGQVREDLFIEDRLHMNRKGYAIWAEVIRPLIME